MYANKLPSQLLNFKVRSDDIKTLSKSELFSDPITPLKYLPGTTFSGTFSAEIFVRGGNAYEVSHILDGTPISFPYFFGGGVSLFNAETIESVTFYPGGMDVRYGNALSGIIDLTLKNGLTSTPQHTLDINLTEINYLQVNPIKDTHSGYLLAFRKTYYDLFLPLFINSPGSEKVPYFQSFQTKYTQKLTPKNTVDVGISFFQEGADFSWDVDDTSEVSTFLYDNKRAILNTSLKTLLSNAMFNSFTLTLEQFVGELNFYSTNQQDLPASWNWKSPSIRLKNELSWAPHPNHMVHIGTAAEYQKRIRAGNYTSTPEDAGESWQSIPGNVNIPTINTVIDENTSLTYASLYIQDKWSFTDSQRLKAGIRLDTYTLHEFSMKSTIQPRVTYENELFPGTTLNLYHGYYTQFRVDDSNTIIHEKQNGILKTKSQLGDNSYERSTHSGFGINHQISSSTLVKVDLFYKNYTQLLINTSPQSRYPEVFYENKGIGKSGGIELMAQKFTGVVSGWATYTLSKTRRKDLDGWFSPPYDALHMVNINSKIDLSYFDIALNLQFNSGKPYIPISKSHTTNSNGEVQLYYGERYSARFNPYFRMDFWIKTKAASFFWTSIQYHLRLGIYNIFNRKNQIDYGYSVENQRDEFQTDFPRIPVFGLELKF